VDRVAQLQEEMRPGLDDVAAAKQPAPLGEAWMLHHIDPFDGSSTILVGSQPDRLDRTLLSTADLPGPRPTIEWAVPSPTGSHIAVGISIDGSEDATVRVIDVETGDMLPDAVPHSFMVPASWLGDGSGFYIRCSDKPLHQGINLRTALHRVGGATEFDPELAGFDKLVVVMPSGDELLIQGLGTSATPTRIKRAGRADWEPLLEPTDGNVIALPRGDELLCLTHVGADRGRVVTIPIDSVTDRATWTELIPESDAAIRGVMPLEDHLVTYEIVDGAHRIRVFGADGSPDHTVALPDQSGLDMLFGFGQGNGEPRVLPDGPTSITFHLGGFDRPPRPFRYDVVTRELTALQPVVRDDRIVATRLTAVAPDGHQVGYWHVRLRDTDGAVPTIIYGYGGFNISMHTPCHPAPLMPWLERGGAVLLPQLRGGGEQGHSQWLAATGTGKQRTFDDLFAVTEDAVARGIATPGHIGFVGGSNGGLTAGAAITQRPDLYRAVVCAIPVVDMIDLPTKGLGRFVKEYGSLDDPEHVASWWRISPLQNLRDGVDYPAVLIDAGTVDSRCPIEPVRAFAARLSEIAGTQGHRVILHERPHVGHVSAEGEVWPLWLDFFITELMDSDT
jgi:prolyl oligopeptidase